MDSSCCYICGIRESDGAIMPKSMEHLISVCNTIQNSTTLVCDILRKILNETVKRDEKICQMCYGHLNNIDFHLKEAQEITDDITHKFLDKSKGVSRYTATQSSSTRSNAVLDNTPSHTQQSSSNKENIHYSKYTNRSPKKVIWSEFEAEKAKSKEASNEAEMTISFNRTTLTSQDEDSLLTEDEMSVNMIDKSKAKLISHILNPGKKQKKKMKPAVAQVYENSEDEVDVGPVRKPPKRVKKEAERSKKVAVEHNQASPVDSDDENNKSKHKRSKRREEPNTAKEEVLTAPKLKPTVFYAKKTVPSTTSRRGDKESTETDELTCNICRRVFKRKLNLQLHYEKIHNIHEQPVVSVLPETHRCSYCTREFTNFKSLKSHEIFAHANKMDSDYDDEDENEDSEDDVKKKQSTSAITPGKGDGKVQPKASCPICHKTFQRAFNAKTHMIRVHEKVKKFVCHICNKGFSTNSDLNQHMVVHGEGKSFKCEMCDREFFNRDSIILHRKQHFQQLTHFCKICQKGFYKASCLNRHLRSHTGERPYSCSFCQKCFSQSTSLKLHIKKCKKNQSNQLSSSSSSAAASSASKTLKIAKGKRLIRMK